MHLVAHCVIGMCGFGKNTVVWTYLVLCTLANHLFDEMPQSASLLVFMFIFVPFYSRRSLELHFSCLSRLNCVVVVQDVT